MDDLNMEYDAMLQDADDNMENQLDHAEFEMEEENIDEQDHDEVQELTVEKQSPQKAVQQTESVIIGGIMEEVDINDMEGTNGELEDKQDSMQFQNIDVEEENNFDQAQRQSHLANNDKEAMNLQDEMNIIIQDQLQQEINPIHEVEDPLEETRGFPQNSQENDNENDSVIDNQYLILTGHHSQLVNASQGPQLFVACLIKELNNKISRKSVSPDFGSRLSRPRSTRNTSMHRQNSLRNRDSHSNQLEIHENNIDSNIGLISTQEPSGFLFKVNSLVGLSHQEAIQILQGPQNIQTFVNTFEDPSHPQSLSVFGFDSCYNELQGHTSFGLITDTIRFLNAGERNQKTQSFKASMEFSGDRLRKPEDSISNDFIFLFGQNASHKEELMNALNKESLLSVYLDQTEEKLRFVRVSVFYQEQEYVLVQKSYYQSTTEGALKKEIGLELRQAFRQKAKIIKKQSQKVCKQIALQEKFIKDMKNGSHTVIQINNHIFVDLGGIECLNSNTNPQLVNNLTLNFGSVTNEILKLSPYYANHDFQTSEAQELSLFNTYLRAQLTQNSKVALICCVTADAKVAPQTMIALDYCHKIKCYFGGITEEEVKQSLLTDDSEYAGYFTHQNKSIYREIGMLFEQYWKIKSKKQHGKVTSIEIIEQVKEQALLISRQYDSSTGSCDPQIKYMMAVLLKDIETFILQFNSTPRKSIQANKSLSCLRMKKDESQSRSATSLSIMSSNIVNQSQQKHNLNRVSHSSVTKSRSRQRQINSTQPNTASLKYASKGKHISGSYVVSPNIKKEKRVSRMSSGSQIQRPQSVQYANMKDQTSHQFQVNPKVFEDYQKEHYLKGSGEIHKRDSIDTPQFQQDSICHFGNNSSIYVRTSAASSIKANRKVRSTNIASQYTSLGQLAQHHQSNAQSDLYCETTDKKSAQKRKLISSGRKRRAQVSKSNLLQDSIRQIEDEEGQENRGISSLNLLPRIELIDQQTTIDKSSAKELKSLKNKCDQQMQEIIMLKEQIKEFELKLQSQKKASTNKLNDAKASLSEHSKIIEIIEGKNQEYKNEVSALRIENSKLALENEDSKKSQDLILQQIITMKQVVEDFKEGEKEKEQLLLKMKQKDERIRELTKENAKLKEERTNDNKDCKQSELVEENKKLKEENIFLIQNQASKIEAVQEKFQTLYTEYKQTLEENKRLLVIQADHENQIKSLEKAKEIYKEQKLDLKHEVKLLKQQIANNNCNKLQKNDESTISMAHQHPSLKQLYMQETSGSSQSIVMNMAQTDEEMILQKADNKVKQKEAVLGDIRNLIQEYKRERKIPSLSSQSNSFNNSR